MAKRIYVRPKDDTPKPLRSNWPDLGQPLGDQEFIEAARVEVAEKFKVKHEYILYRGNKRLMTFKTREEAEEVLHLFRRERVRVWLYCHEPTADQAWEQRQREKAEWRWNSGFGA